MGVHIHMLTHTQDERVTHCVIIKMTESVKYSNSSVMSIIQPSMNLVITEISCKQTAYLLDK